MRLLVHRAPQARALQVVSFLDPVRVVSGRRVTAGESGELALGMLHQAFAAAGGSCTCIIRASDLSMTMVPLVGQPIGRLV